MLCRFFALCYMTRQLSLIGFLCAALANERLSGSVGWIKGNV